MFNYEKVAEIVKGNPDGYNVKNFMRLGEKLEIHRHPYLFRPCLRYTGKVHISGFGIFHLPEIKMNISPHFFVYIALKRPRLDGMALVQKCGDALCCSPAHLELIAPTEYFLRIYEGRYPLPVKHNPNSKYDPREVLTVKFLSRRVGLSFKMISDIMDIPTHAVRRLASPKNWTHLEPEIEKMSYSFQEPASDLFSEEQFNLKFREFYERYELFKPMIRSEFPSNEQPNFFSGAIRRMQIVRERIRSARAESP